MLLNGVRINQLKPYQRNVSTVFQNYALFPHLTVRENIEFGLKRRSGTERAGRVRDLLDLVRLAGKDDRYPAQLSGGERQRVALARSLAVEPDVLLLDEPLSALDPRLRKQVRSELKDLQRRVGITFIFVTHDQEEALSMSDRIALMRDGRIEQEGTPQELYLRPKTKYAASFLGEVNWLRGMAVRPEAIRLSRAAPAAQSNILRGVVEKSVFLGNLMQIHTRLATGETLLAEVSRSSASFEIGEQVHVWWSPADELNLSDLRE